jgi:hypothetical protein
MSSGAGERIKSSAVSAAVDPYRIRLGNDSVNFTMALLALAEANAQNGGSFNRPSPEEAAVLTALAHWRRDAQHVLKRVRGVSAGAPGRGLAENWLKALIAGLDLQRQGLSLVDPNRAADAARLARKRIAESHRLEDRLESVLA